MFSRINSFTLVLLCIMVISVNSFCQTPVRYLTKGIEDEFKTIQNVIETKLFKWKEFSLKNDPRFNLINFKFQGKDTLNHWVNYHFPIEDDNLLHSMYYYCYSPDSTQYVDIYSSHARLDSANGSIQARFEIDSDAHLIDLIRRKRLSILVIGSTASLDDIAWIDNNSFVIVGYKYLEPVRHDLPLRCNAFIYYINLREKIIKLYRNTHSLKRRPDYYSYKFPDFVK